MKHLVMASAVLAGFSCGGISEESALDGPQETSQQSVATECAKSCAQDGTFDIEVSADGASAWEGRRVVLSAIENEGAESNRVVLKVGQIKDGKVTLGCEDALKENYDYPSWAMYVDVDGDGRCGENDVGYQMALYGWAADIQAAIASSEWVAVSLKNQPGWLQPPLGRGEGHDFCSGYFE